MEKYKYGLTIMNPAQTVILHIVGYKEKPELIQEAELRTTLRNDHDMVEVSNLFIRESTQDELNQMNKFISGFKEE